MEELYFSDDTEFESLEIAEEELIDRYVRGELSPEDQSRFERTLAASPRLTERVRFASVWKDKFAGAGAGVAVATPRPAERKTSWLAAALGFSHAERPPRWAIAFSSLLVVALIGLFVGWLILRENSKRLAAQEAQLQQRQRELDKQLADQKAQREQLASQASVTPTPIESASPSKLESPVSRPVVALSLFPGTRSQGASHDVRILPGTKEIQLNLRLRDASYPSYQVTIRSVDGGGGFSVDQLQPRKGNGGSVLFVRVPAGRLGLGDYLVRVNGRSSAGATEAVDDYQFRVIK